MPEEGTQVAKDQQPAHAGGAAGAEKGLSFLEGFVDKYFMSMPKWVRTFTYLLFVAVLAYSAYHAIGGEHAVKGRVMESDKGGLKVAKGYEIYDRKDSYGTNSKGEYHLILGPLEYVTLLAEAECELVVMRGEYQVAKQKVAFDRNHGLFDDIPISLEAKADAEPATAPRERVAAPPAFLLWAAEPPRSPLILLSIQLRSGLKEVREGTLELVDKAATVGLGATRSGGAPAGALPVVSGQVVSFGDDYYFSVTEARLDSAYVRFTARTGVFSSYKETFPLKSRPRPGQAVELYGDQGSRIRIVLAMPYEVVVYDKKDIAAIREPLKDSVLEKGLLARERPAPLGFGSQTNALYAGREVPYTAVQAAAEAALASGVPLKTVQYKLELKSGVQTEIQLGGSRACEDDAPISAAELKKLVEARSEAEFLAAQKTLGSRCEGARVKPMATRLKTKKR